MSRIEPNTQQPNDVGTGNPGATSNGILVIRFWREHPGPDGFRARVSRTTDISHRPRNSTVVSSVEEVRHLVDAWLHECAAW